jgi:hypothetical protein
VIPPDDAFIHRPLNIPQLLPVHASMNISPYALLRVILATCGLAALPSCEGVPGEYGPNYGGYDDGPGYSSYQSSPTYYGSGTGYYGGGYSRPYYGSSYYGGRYYDNRNHDHEDHERHSSDNDRNKSSNSSHKSSSDDDIRLVKVRDGTRGDVPEGYHSKEWYQKRGISLSKNVYETREGDRRGYSGSPSKSSSSSNKSSSNKSNSEKSSSNKSDSSNSSGRNKG